MLEGRGKRQKIVTKDLVRNYILNSSPTVSGRVRVRGKPAKHGASASFKPNIKGKWNASERKLRSQNSIYEDSDDDSADEMPDELNEKIENNTDRINYVQENFEVVTRLILSVLPISSINNIVSQIKDVQADDHIMMQDFINQVLEKNSANQGKVNVLNDTVVATSTEGDAAAAATAVVVEETEPKQPAAATFVPDTLTATLIDQTVNKAADLVHERLDELYRKKNIIVTGMSEENDDDNMIQEMFRVMRCQYMLRDIVGTPTRLGARGRKSRAIKIEMRNELAVERIMECKKYLKDRNENFYLVYVNRDLSKSDRDKEIQLRRQKNRGFYDESAAGAGVVGGTGSQNRNHGAQITGTPNGGSQNIQNGVGSSEGSEAQISQNGAQKQKNSEMPRDNGSEGVKTDETLERERSQQRINVEIDGFITFMRLGTLYENVNYWEGYTENWVVHYEGVQSGSEGTKNNNLGNDISRGLIIHP